MKQQENKEIAHCSYHVLRLHFLCDTRVFAANLVNVYSIPVLSCNYLAESLPEHTHQLGITGLACIIPVLLELSIGPFALELSRQSELIDV